MTHDSKNEEAIRELSYAELIRLRPAMFVGSTALFGLINYFVCPIALLLGQGIVPLKLRGVLVGTVAVSDVLPK